MREIAKIKLTGSRSFKESKNNIEDNNIIIGKIIFIDKNNFNKKKKNRHNRTFIKIIIITLVGGKKMTRSIIRRSKSEGNTIFFTEISLATIIFINYNDKL